VINDKLQQAFNNQLNAELYSAYLYLSMAAYFNSTGLAGCANWMLVQAREEQSHAMKFFDYINKQGGRVTLKSIDTPPHKWSSPLDVFQAVHKHEQKVTNLIKGLMDLAVQQDDQPAIDFLMWFMDEQIEEEASADEVVQKMTDTDTDTDEFSMIDRELAQRMFSTKQS
jgi:ferritin